MKTLFLSVAVVSLAACSSTPKPPDWQLEAKGSMERANAAYLEGNARIDAAELARARSQLSRTGRADLLGTAELLHCATRVASLVFEPCAGFESLRVDATPEQVAYASYLRGQAQPQDMALLPAPQRALAHSGGSGGAGMPGAADPLSRLVAAGVLLQTGQVTPAVITQAIDTASAQGWRRPLLAWLGVQAQRAEQGGDAEEAARLRRRIALTQGPVQGQVQGTAPAPVSTPKPAP